MLKRLIALGSTTVVLLLAVAACGGEAEPTPAQLPSPPIPPPAPAPTSGLATPTPVNGCDAGAITFKVENQDPAGSGAYKFSPNEMTFNAGDTVCFALSAETEPHTFTVEELGIDVVMDAKTTSTLNFKFDKPGDFKLTCIFHIQMTGTITVQ